MMTRKTLAYSGLASLAVASVALYYNPSSDLKTYWKRELEQKLDSIPVTFGLQDSSYIFTMTDIAQFIKDERPAIAQNMPMLYKVARTLYTQRNDISDVKINLNLGAADCDTHADYAVTVKRKDSTIQQLPPVSSCHVAVKRAFENATDFAKNARTDYAKRKTQRQKTPLPPLTPHQEVSEKLFSFMKPEGL